MTFRQMFDLFFKRFVECNTVTWAASVAFYTALSLAPLLIIFLALSPHFDPALKDDFINEVRNLMGNTGAEAINLVFENAQERIDLMSMSGIFGTATLVVSASLIFGELRAALNQILEKNPTPADDKSFTRATIDFLKSRILQMGLALGFTFIMIASLILSTGISAFLRYGATYLGDIALIANIAFSFSLYLIVFGCMFHFIPKNKIHWKQSLQAATITSVLFVIGKELVGFYLGHSFLSSAYGAAGSVIVLLAWVYYSSLIIFIGAHVSFILEARNTEATVSDE